MGVPHRLPDPALVGIAEEVSQALALNKPVVALESTIITHGMPFPRNVETALAVDRTVRAHGAIPATIAVIGGRIEIGLSPSQIEQLGEARNVAKLSRDNLAAALASGATGSTTVAATMIGAHLAGIGVFATGGIGGVHRGAAETMDISADLDEFARTPVTVVCAGAKALLDLPRTLEYLETRGVPVVGYGSDQFAAFWSRSSGLTLQIRFDSVQAIARFIDTRRRLGLTEGVIVSNPPPEASEIPAGEMEGFITEALAAAQAANVTGKAVTPFLLGKIHEITNGRSLDTNIALIQNNAAVAADIAVAQKELDA